MRRFCVLLLLAALGGCKGIGGSPAEEGVHALAGESCQERADRHALDRYRSAWSTPGRTPYEVEVEARANFRRKHGRDPNLNWSAR